MFIFANIAFIIFCSKRDYLCSVVWVEAEVLRLVGEPLAHVPQTDVVQRPLLVAWVGGLARLERSSSRPRAR